MKNIRKILNYFEDFEKCEHLSKVEIKNCSSIFRISELDLLNFHSLKKKITIEKSKAIASILQNTDIQININDIMKQLKNLVSYPSTNNLPLIKNVLPEKLFNSIDVHNFITNKINTIIIDTDFFLMYPIISHKNGENLIPIITFQCKLLPDCYEINKHYTNIIGLSILIANLFNCSEYSVSDLMGESFNQLLRSLSFLQQNKTSVLKTFELIDNELKSQLAEYRFDGIDSFKTYENWEMTKQIIISTKTLSQIETSIFTEGLNCLNKFIDDKKIPKLIKKYIFQNPIPTNVNNVRDIFHFASYTDDFTINSMQWKILSSNISNTFVSASGAVGTGKTAVLKEIIADNFVKRTKKLIDIWDCPWNRIDSNDYSFYCSPLETKCEHSIVISGIYQNALSNVISELSEEIEHFNKTSSLEKKQKSTFAAYLDNKTFLAETLNPLLNFLNDCEIKADLENCKENITYFNDIWYELTSAFQEIQSYLSKRQNIISKINNIGLSDILTCKTTLHKMQVDVYSKIAQAKILLDAEISDLNKLNDKLLKFEHDITKISNLIEPIKNEFTALENILVKYRNYSRVYDSSPLVSNILLVFFNVRYGTISKLDSKHFSKKEHLDTLHGALQHALERHSQINTDIHEQNSIIKSIKNNLDKLNRKKYLIDEFISLLKRFKEIANRYDISCNWNDSSDIFMSFFTKKRYVLFQLSLKINNFYIIKNRFYICHNLTQLSLKRSCFNQFNNQNFDYDAISIKYIKSIWETIFICFPVISTNLCSLNTNECQMVRELFDILIIDNGNKIPIHHLISPLYRFRKTLFLNNEFDTKPEFISTTNFIQSCELGFELENNIDVRKFNAGNCADKASDVYTDVNGEKKGLILTEHTRCEKSIMAFSNTYVYKNSLKFKTDDAFKEFLGYNLCFIDTRGKTFENNTNQTEIDICKNIVHWFTQKYGNHFKSNIGIISPYKNQVSLLRKHILDVKIGTDSEFYGKEKDIILLSTVIKYCPNNSNSYRKQKKLLGHTPLFFNNTFSRAKKQLIIVGNYQAYANSDNYLKKALDTIKIHGKIYSLYDAKLIVNNTSPIFEKQFKNLFNCNIEKVFT